jgi:hypothetical protein
MRVCQIWPRRVSLLSLVLDPFLPPDSLNNVQKLIIGLYYCELHAASQVELQAPEYRWKFNKARQGWLMRNVWNDVEVSLPLLPFYSRPAGERVEKSKS